MNEFIKCNFLLNRLIVLILVVTLHPVFRQKPVVSDADGV